MDEYTIVSADENVLRSAINSGFKDFEDAVQYFCAKEKKAELIISNDKKGFQKSDIETISSSDFYYQYVQE